MFRITEIRTLAEPDWNTIELSNPEIFYRPFEKMARDRRKARYQSVMKVLKSEQSFKLVSEDLPANFFSLSDQSNPVPPVNISVIVGENGAGKSTLIELMLRLLNNAAYALRLGLDGHKTYDLRFVRDIHAELYFEKDQPSRYKDSEASTAKYCLKQQDAVISLYLTHPKKRRIWSYDFRKQDSHVNPNIARKALSGLFYTIVMNYSAYSNNVEDLQAEYTEDYELEPWEKDSAGNSLSQINPAARIWMYGIFHKNDSYQLPLVLTPYRSRGNVNFNNEQNLSRDRLCFLAMMNPSPLDNILEGKSPHSIVFDINQRFSPQLAYGRGEKNLLSFGLLDEMKWIISNSHEAMDSGDFINSQDYIPTHDGEVKFSEEIVKLWSKVWHIDFFELAGKLNNKSPGDGSRALSYLVYKTVKITGTYLQFKSFSTDLEKLCGSYIAESSKGSYSSSPLYSYSPGPDSNEAKLARERIEKYIRSLSELNTHISLKIRRTLALLIFQHYSTQKRQIGLAEFNRVIQDRLDRQEEVVKELCRGCGDSLAPVRHTWDFQELMPAPAIRADVRFRIIDGKNSDEESVGARALSSGERQLLNVLSGVVYHVGNLASKFTGSTRLVLPKLADSEVGFSPEPDRSEPVHLNISYPYISLIFDEAELYFHPKYQTQFIRATLAALAGLNIADKIRGVNIIYATHSPFILSDMPQCNVLALKDGRQLQDFADRTFCANVYDILANGFFMSSFIGEFAEDKVKSIISCLDETEEVCGDNRDRDCMVKRSPDAITLKDAMTLKKEIELIGDDFIRNNLLRRWQERFGELVSLEDERAQLMNRLAEIDARLNIHHDNDSD